MEYTELLNQVLSILLPALATLIAAWFGMIGAKIKSKYEQSINTEITKTVVNDTVKFVQQLYADLDGAEKFQKALERVVTILNEKGIPISEAEIKMLIESAVFGLKQGLKEADDKVIDESTGEEG